MSGKKSSKFERLRASLAGFLVFIGIFTGVGSAALQANEVYAISNNENTVLTSPSDSEDNNISDERTAEENAESDENASTTAETNNTTTTTDNKSKGDTCKDSLGALGWLVCPATGAIAKGVDFLYNLINDFLVINPISTDDGTPVYEIWKYCRGVTNVVFIIFLLIVIYSQITGIGISNYGIKKSLPKLIVAAILVNLSFIICLLAVDASNIIGNSLRGLFNSVQETVLANNSIEVGAASYTGMYSAIAGGTALAIGGTAVAFETGAIWMLIPTALGALVAAVTGLITIALRQAVVVLLIMIAPLAMVANILPNTEKWFKKWKDLLTKMLVFYPMFSLLFGASSLAGFAIMMSAKSGWGLLLGTAVQIFPLFFSWSLMKMSGTFLGDINSKIQSLSSRPVAANRAWAESRRALTKQKNLARENAYTPSLRLAQFISNRRIARDEELNEHAETVRARGQAYSAMRNYKKTKSGRLVMSKEGERAYADQMRRMDYQEKVDTHKVNFNEGLSENFAANAKQKARLYALDMKTVKAADKLKTVQARAEIVDFRNAEGFHDRMKDAINAHMDEVNGYTFDNDKNKLAPRKDYTFHFGQDDPKKIAALARYNAAHQIMGNAEGVQYVAATATRGYETQRKIHESTNEIYAKHVGPTKDLVYRLNELTQNGGAKKNIDAIVAGLRVLNQRGDTDLVKEQLDNVLDKKLGGGIELGTHASQALASFLMFEVKDNDPALRRFGKYINLETARMYNKNERKESFITYDEYLKGYHDEPDGSRMYANKDAKKLLEGTSLDSIERTALSNLDSSLKKAYGYDSTKKNNDWDVAGYLKRRDAIQTAFEPAFLSASLKWLSGSEQINSGIKFWTGYELKQKKDENGNVMVDDEKNPIYDLEPVWENGGFGKYKDEVQKYFREKSNAYIKDQTTGQILNMRTDYRDPIMEHLLATYLEADNDDEMSAKRNREYREAYDEIQTRYADEPAKDAKEKREKDVKALKMKFAGKQLRKILGESGKLKQIYRTRTSGTAINAKDWLRKWVNLDDEDALRREMNYYDAQRANKAKTMDSADGDDNVANHIYDADTREVFLNELQALKDEIADEEPDAFFEDTLKQVNQWFGKDSLIAKKYEIYYRNDDPSADSIELYKYLRELLSDPDNYPDV